MQTTDLSDFRWLWPLHENDRLEFAAKDVCRLTGIAAHSLQNWANRGLLDFSGKSNPGKGGARLYSKKAVLIIRFAQEMITLGFEPSMALAVGMLIDLKLSLGIAKAGRRHDATQFVYGATAIIHRKPSAPATALSEGNSEVEHLESEYNKLGYAVEIYARRGEETDFGIPLKAFNPSLGAALIVNVGELIMQVQKKVLPDWRRWIEQFNAMDEAARATESDRARSAPTVKRRSRKVRIG
ncbi:MerR family transcriptional regulator [Bradyrhizobium sp. CCBAU 53338]|uniref:MerR family transcriptional regulator n=1 Tax=Bradyrhizobium sp. CCBAU 53338 TaxID=1325111 RepID=UPI00188AD0C2|nr:MerR family transcriptional regulator [Bradyrhizobium sp. CCBAU 53338]QOZ52952.1 hypothetical protein XH90_17450 [Bradyrhizobium sp. CCBAU 53338]